MAGVQLPPGPCGIPSDSGAGRMSEMTSGRCSGGPGSLLWPLPEPWDPVADCGQPSGDGGWVRDAGRGVSPESGTAGSRPSPCWGTCLLLGGSVVSSGKHRQCMSEAWCPSPTSHCGVAHSSPPRRLPSRLCSGLGSRGEAGSALVVCPPHPGRLASSVKPCFGSDQTWEGRRGQRPCWMRGERQSGSPGPWMRGAGAGAPGMDVDGSPTMGRGPLMRLLFPWPWPRLYMGGLGFPGPPAALLKVESIRRGQEP